MNSEILYKPSKYNFLIKVNSSKYLLYNSLRNGLLLLDKEKEIDFVKNIINKNKIGKEDIGSNYRMHKKLLDSGIIVNFNENENTYIKKRIIKSTEIIKNKNLYLTICPTNSCNMACPYCFEENKPRNEKMSEETIERIVEYIEWVLHSNHEIEILNITWYGGEPLLAPEIIKKLSVKLISLAKNNKLKYKADIITNGVLLNNKNWQLLEECQIKSGQVTLDGYKVSHNESRPLIGKNRDSYSLILNNLKNKPSDFKLRIRINADKEVGKYLHEFLFDLEHFNIWPQNAKTTNLSMHIREKYTTNYFKGEENLLSQQDFFKLKDIFTVAKIQHYNKWAKKEGLKLAKRAFHYPKPTNLTCAEVALPTAFVIDHRGDMYKCWGFVNNKDKVIQNITDGFEKLNRSSEIKFASEFNKYHYDSECKKCKFLPICDIDCMWKHTATGLTKNCCEWKFTMKEKFKNQYLLLLNHPEQIQNLSIFEENNKNENCSC